MESEMNFLYVTYIAVILEAVICSILINQLRIYCGLAIAGARAKPP